MGLKAFIAEGGPAAPPPLRVPGPPAPTSADLGQHVAYILAVLDHAASLREQALRNLSGEERRFLFEHAANLAGSFLPQLSGSDAAAKAQAASDQRFIRLVGEKLDYAALAAAAETLARLADDRWLQRLDDSFRNAEMRASAVPGVTGDVVLVRETPHGLFVIGGRGPNSYDLDQRFALVIDLGGDDVYRGAIAASAGVERGVGAVIDLAGNDVYEPTPLGLATGRLGVGLLIDRTGDDVYRLANGSGGTGFAGIGVLYDMKGRDRYEGARFTQGAAVGGVGLLLDGAGDDTYTSFGYAIGFGGPLGVGAVIDAAGDDRYQCGEKYPSNYNAEDAPGGRPGDRLFQYDCFGLGAGAGQRVYPAPPEEVGTGGASAGPPSVKKGGMAGGLGALIDLSGDDRYRTGNFSQGFGYFFGAGLKLDLGGDDEHEGARFGHAAAAHGGVGLFIDYRGDDRYVSSGPFYNGGTAWHLSVALFIDAGTGRDVYNLRASDGLGLAGYHSWSVFIDEGGFDRYVVGSGPDGAHGMGMATDGSMSGFFDLGGEDEYVGVPSSASRRGNGATVQDGEGGLFSDR